MKVVVLGAWSGLPVGSGNGTSFFIEHDRNYLVDCGIETPHQLIRSGRRITDVDVIIITHMHADHVSGLPMLLKSMEMCGMNEVEVYASDPDSLRKFVELTFPGFWDGGAVKLTGIENSPIRHARTSHTILGYGIRIGDFAYSSDTRPCESIVELARGCRLLAHEASMMERDRRDAERYGHSTAKEAAEIASRARVEKLLLVHMYKPVWDLKKGIEEAREAFSGEIILARDLMELDV